MKIVTNYDKSARATPGDHSDCVGCGLTNDSEELLAIFDGIEQAVNADSRRAELRVGAQTARDRQR